MTVDSLTIALMEDVDRFSAFYRRQLRDDPGNEVALAMYAADVKRAQDKLQQHLASPAYRTRKPVSELDTERAITTAAVAAAAGATSGVYVDGRRAAP